MTTTAYLETALQLTARGKGQTSRRGDAAKQTFRLQLICHPIDLYIFVVQLHVTKHQSRVH